MFSAVSEKIAGKSRRLRAVSEKRQKRRQKRQDTEEERALWPAARCWSSWQWREPRD